MGSGELGLWLGEAVHVCSADSVSLGTFPSRTFNAGMEPMSFSCFEVPKVGQVSDELNVII